MLLVLKEGKGKILFRKKVKKKIQNISENILFSVNFQDRKQDN